MTLAQAMMAASAPMLIQKAVVEGKPEEGLMATGLVGGRITDLPSVATLVDGIVVEALARITALTGAPGIASSAAQ